MATLIVGDTHFGVRNNHLKYLEFQEKWFKEELLPVAKKCDHVIFLGDIFESRNSLSPVVLQVVRKCFKELTNIAKIHCILGNHDIYFRNTRDVHWLSILQDLGVTIYENPSEVILEGKKCLMLPWVVPEDVKNVEKLLTENKYDILFGHLEITGFEMVKGVPEEKGFNKTLFNNCKKVYSGHFHLGRFEGNIKYVGTPFELSWSDFDDPKKIILLDGNEETEIFSKNTPKHIKINSQLFDITKLSKELIFNNIVRVKIEKMEDNDRINYLERLNQLEPLSLTLEEHNEEDLEIEENIEASIKDTMGFLFEYLSFVEIPVVLDKTVILKKIEDLYKKLE